MQKHDKILNKSGELRTIKGLNPEMSLQEALDQQLNLMWREDGFVWENDDDKDDDSQIIEGYTLEKKLIIYAWARYRPVQDEAI